MQRIAELRGLIDEADEDPIPNQQQPSNLEQRGAAPVGNPQIMASYGMGSVPNATPSTDSQKRADSLEDRYNTVEYRMAFMDYCVNGRVSQELRSDEVTTTNDIAAIIPSTILKEVINKVESYGQVFNRVRKLNVKGGLTIPILSLKHTASWIGESTPSSKQKINLDTKISFSYYGLECKISTSLLTDVTALSVFETTITDLIVEAMVKALDLAIISGDGIGKPKGITKDNRVPTKQIVTLTALEFVSWDSWKKKVLIIQ